MRRVVFILLALFWTVAVVYAGTSVSFGTASLTQATVAPTLTVSAHDLGVIAIVSPKGQNDTSVTTPDSAGDTWQRVGNSCNNGTTVQIDLWYAMNMTAGAHTLTLSSAGAGTFRSAMRAFHGVALTGALDQAISCNTGSGGTAVTTATITPTNQFVLGIAASGSTTIALASADLNSYSGNGGVASTTVFARLLSRADVGGTTTSTGDSLNSAGTWASAITSFKMVATLNDFNTKRQVDEDYAWLDLWNWRLARAFGEYGIENAGKDGDHYN